MSPAETPGFSPLLSPTHFQESYSGFLNKCKHYTGQGYSGKFLFLIFQILILLKILPCNFLELNEDQESQYRELQQHCHLYCKVLLKLGKSERKSWLWNEETLFVSVPSLSLWPFSSLCSQSLTATYRPHSVPTMARTCNRHCHWERTGHSKGPQ